MNDFVKYNFHTHTFRCLHATGTEREYIESAIESGMKILGFADHVPCPFKEEGRVSGIRMKMDVAPEYATTLKALREEYKNDIKIYIGFEAEYLTDFFDEQLEMCRELECDYMILGPHFITPEWGTVYTGTETQSEERLTAYVDNVLAGAKTGCFMYIAHPDLIRFTGDEKIYREQMSRLCHELKAMDIPVEVNNVGMAERRHYPTPLFWEIAGEIGIKAVIGLDAHSIRDMENKAAYDKCMELVEKYKVNMLTEPEQVIPYLERNQKLFLKK